MANENSTPYYSGARVFALLATAAVTFWVGEPLLNAEPVPPVADKCCGGTGDGCCGCIPHLTKFMWTGTTTSADVCITAPSGGFMCAQEEYICFDALDWSYSTKNGTGCSSTCSDAFVRWHPVITLVRCTTEFGGCD
jgi:hypothetical protein